MTQSEDSAEKSFYTEQGLRLRAISPEEFHEDRPKALTPLQIEENLIYEARGLSKRLEAAGSAVSFNIMAANLDAAHPNLASRGFLLLALDDDFRVVSSHKSLIRDDRLVENAPINVMSQRRLPLGAQIQRLYLVSDNDTTFDSIVHTKSSLDAQAYNSQLTSV